MSERVKILPNESFGFQRITVERPLRVAGFTADPTRALAEPMPQAPDDTIYATFGRGLGWLCLVGFVLLIGWASTRRRAAV